MKNKILLLLVLIGMAFSVQAQKSFQKGNILISPGVGLGSNYGFYSGSRVRPSIIVNADYGVHDYVSVGVYAGGTFFKGVSGIDFGVRGNFHWWQLLDDKISADLKQDQVDVYATFWMGGEIIKIRNLNGYGSQGGFDIGFTQGVRWYPKANNRFALFAEVGFTPIAYSNVGVTIKIGE